MRVAVLYMVPHILRAGCDRIAREATKSGFIQRITRKNQCN